MKTFALATCTAMLMSLVGAAEVPADLSSYRFSDYVSDFGKVYSKGSDEWRESSVLSFQIPSFVPLFSLPCSFVLSLSLFLTFDNCCFPPFRPGPLPNTPLSPN